MAVLDYKYSNNSVSTLAWSITAISTTLVIQTGDNTKFVDSFPFTMTLEQFDENNAVIKREIVRATSRTWDIYNIDRAIESCLQSDTATTQTSNALDFDEWSVVSMRVTAWQMQEINSKVFAVPDANDIMDLSTNQTVATWVKSFNNHPRQSTYSAPTLANQYAPKQYVDDQVSLASTPESFWTSDYVAWENLVEWECVFLANEDFYNTRLVSSKTWSTSNDFWDWSTLSTGIFFLVPKEWFNVDWVANIILSLSKTWSPVDNINFNLFENDKVTPVAWFSTFVIDWSTLTWSLDDYTIDLWNINLSNNNQYFLEITRTWWQDAVNYYSIWVSSTNNYEWYWFSDFDWSTRTDSNNDPYFEVQYWKSYTLNNVYKYDSRYNLWETYINRNTVNQWDDALIIFDWIYSDPSFQENQYVNYWWYSLIPEYFSNYWWSVRSIYTTESINTPKSQSIIFYEDITISSIDLLVFINKTSWASTWTAVINIRIETDLNWSPSWTLADPNSSWTLSIPFWLSPSQWSSLRTVSFTWSFTLSSWNKYHILLDRSWTNNIQSINIYTSDVKEFDKWFIDSNTDKSFIFEFDSTINNLYWIVWESQYETKSEFNKVWDFFGDWNISLYNPGKINVLDQSWLVTATTWTTNSIIFRPISDWFMPLFCEHTWSWLWTLDSRWTVTVNWIEYRRQNIIHPNDWWSYTQSSTIFIDMKEWIDYTIEVESNNPWWWSSSTTASRDKFIII